MSEFQQESDLMVVSEDRFRIDIEERSAGGQQVPVYLLHDTNEQVRAEVWPSNGFNCLRWQYNMGEGFRDLLYVAPDWETNPVPTRSGFPVLFPFPNRIRDGRFVFKGQEYQLPCNDSSGKNAIHGFAPRQPWDVIGTHVDAQSASITGQFTVSPAHQPPEWIWPGQGILTITIGLLMDRLSLKLNVVNAGDDEFPFGLGFHPYFRHPESLSPSIEESYVWAPTSTMWELIDNLPTGRKIATPTPFYFPKPTALDGRVIDDLYGDLDGISPIDPEGRLAFRGEIGLFRPAARLTMWTSPSFRELVLFTPPHRQALCIEPYTCTTDAVNLERQGVDAGWQVLQPGDSWQGEIEVRILKAGH